MLERDGGFYKLNLALEAILDHRQAGHASPVGLGLTTLSPARIN